MKVVCDTNILISALVFPGGPPDQVLNLARLGEFSLFVSPDMISEFRRVLTTKFRFTDTETDTFIDRITAISQMAYPKERVDLIRRKDSDNRILECAIAAEADFLVTGDKKDILPLKAVGQTRIVTASEFLTHFTQR